MQIILINPKLYLNLLSKQYCHFDNQFWLPMGKYGYFSLSFGHLFAKLIIIECSSCYISTSTTIT